MAKPTLYAGNKMSLRSGALDQIKRIDSIASTLGTIGDSLTSTLLSIILAGATLAGGGLLDLFLLSKSPGLHDVGGVIVPFVLILIGTALIALNVLLINPSQGFQFMVSVKYWYDAINNSKKGYLIQEAPFRFAKESGDNDIIYANLNGKFYYMAIFKVQGKVSKTLFDEDLEVLSQLNRDSLEALERDTLRSTVVTIAKPRVTKKELNPNATPNMKKRAEILHQIVKDLDNAQSLNTYIILTSRNFRALEMKINNQLTFFNQGLMTTVYQLQGKELLNQTKEFFA